jgi:hypothetical protein
MKMLNDLQVLVGKRILLHKMCDDPKTNPIKPNTCGTIMSVDDMGYYMVKWDCGRMLNLLPDEDEYEFLDN